MSRMSLVLKKFAIWGFDPKSILGLFKKKRIAYDSYKSLLIIVMAFAFFFVLIATSSFENIDDQGNAKGVIIEIIQTLGVNLEDYRTDKTLPLAHISNIHNFLKHYFNSDRDFYRKGGKPAAKHELTHDQVNAVMMRLRGCYAGISMPDPAKKKKADVIIFSGEQWSMEKRFHSLKQFLNAGYECDNVFILSINQHLEKVVKLAVQNHSELFKNRRVHYVLSDNPKASHDEVLKNPLIPQEFYFISDPEYALTLNEACIRCQDKNYLGVFVRPITSDPNEYIKLDLQGYKFDEYITDPEGQKLAAAYSALNRFAYVIDQEIKLFAPLSQ